MIVPGGFVTGKIQKESDPMSGSVGRTPEFFSFQKLQGIVDAYEGKKSIQAKKDESPIARAIANDQVNLGQDKQDVMILPGRNLMKAYHNIDSESVAGYLKEKGVNVEEKLEVVGGVSAKLDKESIKSLQDEGYMVYDNSPRNLIPDVPQATAQAAQDGSKPWDMPRIEDVKWTGAEKMHQQGFTGKGQVIAVIDSGYDHPEKPLVGWTDIVDGSKKPIDPNGHGTHVAGDTIKMAPDADLVGIRVMSADGRGRPSDIVKGLEWAIKNKEKFDINTINMSLGSGPDGYPYYLDPINQAVAKAVDEGISVVVAAGNSGPGARTIGSPADAPEALTIGAALNPNQVSDFSSRGPTDDNLVKPDVLAPGEFITSWAVPNSQLDKIATTVETLRRMTPTQLRQLFTARPELIEALGLPKDILDNEDVSLEQNVKLRLPPMHKPTPDTIAGPGTSFASPEVAGIVAGLKQAHPNATPKDIKEALMKTADNMGDYTNMEQGAGFVRADEAHEQLNG